MLDEFLVPEKTVVTAKGDGPAIEMRPTEGRIFLLTLTITDIIEQESIDVRIHGSSDGATWDANPIASFPQKFYREESPLLLDLSAQPHIKFVRAHWDVNRWGRGTETPMFEFSVRLREIPREILQEAAARIPAR